MRKSQAGPHSKWRAVTRHHPVVGWLKMPSTNCRMHFADGVYMYRTNADGFRGNGEFTIEKPPNVKRVLVFGDSFTEGACVDDGQRYSDFLGASPDIEVYNFGISSTGTDQQYLIHRDIASAYEHDLVVIGVWVENIRRNVSQSRVHFDRGEHYLTPKPYFTVAEDGDLELHQVPVPRPVLVEEATSTQLDGVDAMTRGPRGLTARAAHVLTQLGPAPKQFVQQAIRWQPFSEFDEPDHPSWDLTRRILARWCEESTAPVLIVPIPVYQYTEKTASADGMRERFAELHDPPHVHVHDLLPDLWSYPREERRQFRFPVDHHLTESGHRAVAASIEPVMHRILDENG